MYFFLLDMSTFCYLQAGDNSGGEKPQSSSKSLISKEMYYSKEST